MIVRTSPATAGRIHGLAASHADCELGLPIRSVVDDQGVAGVGAPRQFDRLVDGQMATFGIVVGRAQQRAFHEQEVGAAREVDDRVARPRVAGVDEAGAVGALHREAPGGDVVTTTDEAHRQRTDRERPVGVVLVDRECIVKEAGHAPRSPRPTRPIRARPPGGRWTGRRGSTDPAHGNR